MSGELLVRNCAPVLAGIKTANLFTIPDTGCSRVRDDLRGLNTVFVRRGLRAIPVGRTKNRILIYIYRPSRLIRDFCNPIAREILRDKGYSADDSAACVMQIIRRIHCQDEFPHEIGLFLGYPAEDVRGYMIHKGKCSKCCGYWHVYENPQQAELIFSRYRRCTRSYLHALERGIPLEELVVPEK